MNPHQKPQEDVVVCEFHLGDCVRCGKRADRDNQQAPCIRPRGPFAPMVEPSWTGNPRGLANELRRVANVWGGEYRMTQLLRDAADEIDTLTTTPTYEAGRRDMREEAGKVAQDEADDIERHQPSARDSWQQGRGAMAKSIATAIRNLPTEPLGGEG